MSFNYQAFDLPVKEVIPSIQSNLKSDNTLILKAPTGAGKSTLVPIALLDEDWLQRKKIYLLEPRRLAAKTIAIRMAEMLGEKVGQTVGYRIRFENRVSEQTRLEVVTEGILTNILHADNALEDTGLIIFDEFHERSIHADIALALCRECQSVLREDLRMLIMSATIDMPKLSKLLNAPIVESKGRMFPVDIKYVGDADEYVLPELTANVVLDAVKKHEGDALVFLPGQREILQCAGLLKRKMKGFKIHTLYGQMPPNQQMAAIFPDKNGARKVVIATNIAETSLTIEGIKIVVDSGFARSARFNASSGLSKLETIRISKNSADQRAGRAGRLSAGVCFRMWTKATEARMLQESQPEIENADLCGLALDVAQWGVQDVNDLAWLSPPPKGHYFQAVELLQELEALEDNKVTAHGVALSKLPCHPRIGHMLLKAEENDTVQLATDIAPILEERDPLPPESGIDLNLRIAALRRYRTENAGNKRLARMEKGASQYRRLFNIEADNSSVNDFETGLLIAYAYPERIACSRPGNNAQFQMANGKIAAAGHKDDLAFEPWLAVAHVNERSHVGKIFMASPLDPKDLASMVKEKEIVEWNTKLGGLKVSRDLRIGSIVLKSSPMEDADEDLILAAINKAIQKEGENLLDWNKEVEQWQNRVLSLRKWNPELELPDVSKSKLITENASWLNPYLLDVETPEELKALNLLEILQYSLSYEQQQMVKQLVPERLEVPSGAKVKLQYFEDGSAPVLAVRLQSCFGWQVNPTINNGKTNVMMHLQSPGYKVVQITNDLASFWQNAYHEVRKELRIKYAKHDWPEEPWNALPQKRF